MGASAPEGVEAVVPYRGAVADILHQLVGGLRSGLSYAGATCIAELQQNAEFIRRRRRAACGKAARMMWSSYSRQVALARACAQDTLYPLRVPWGQGCVRR